MRTWVIRMTLIIVLAVCGCQHNEERTHQRVLNAPASREEGWSLMRAVDGEGITRQWSMGVTHEVRRRMSGRLLTAGLSVEEIEGWIVSPLNGSNQTSRGEARL